MKLSPADINSPVWGRIKEHVEKRIAELRRENDSDTLDATKTSRLRGKLAFAKELLALADKDSAPEPEASDGE